MAKRRTTGRTKTPASRRTRGKNNDKRSTPKSGRRALASTPSVADGAIARPLLASTAAGVASRTVAGGAKRSESGAKRSVSNPPLVSPTASPTFATPHPLHDAIRVGICGIGRTGFGRIRTEIGANRHFRIQAAYDVIPERALQLTELFGATAHPSFEDLLKDNAVELVIIATRSDTHAALAAQALRAGKHVVVEKPMATTLADADMMLEVAKRSKGRLFVRHNRRFDPPFLCAKDVLASGKLGQLHSVQIRVGEYVRRSDWQTLKRFGGGQLLNWGPHVIDWALQLIGGRAVEQWSDLKLIAAAGDAEDHVKLILKGPAPKGSTGGAVADLEISGANAVKQPPFVLCGDRGSLVIDGSRARLRYLRQSPRRATLIASADTPGQDDKRYKVDDKADWVEEEFPAVPSQSHTTDYWTEVYRALRKGTDFPVSLAQAREVMRVIDEARKGTRF